MPCARPICISFARLKVLLGTQKKKPLVRNSQNQETGDIKCRVCACLKNAWATFLKTAGVPEPILSCLSCSGKCKAFFQAFYRLERNNLKIVSAKVWGASEVLFEAKCLIIKAFSHLPEFAWIFFLIACGMPEYTRLKAPAACLKG